MYNLIIDASGFDGVQQKPFCKIENYNVAIFNSPGSSATKVFKPTLHLRPEQPLYPTSKKGNPDLARTLSLLLV
ncbi:MAG TPA: hypothetical protein VM935_18270 [Chitinophagaceae bacterium]|nr:hypothetical protein [Chitinophagaceae bacterium]